MPLHWNGTSTHVHFTIDPTRTSTCSTCFGILVFNLCCILYSSKLVAISFCPRDFTVGYIFDQSFYISQSLSALVLQARLVRKWVDPAVIVKACFACVKPTILSFQGNAVPVPLRACPRSDRFASTTQRESPQRQLLWTAIVIKWKRGSFEPCYRARIRLIWEARLEPQRLGNRNCSRHVLH